MLVVKHPTHGPCVMMFLEEGGKGKGTWSHPCGKFDSRDHLDGLDAAAAGLCEETCGLVVVDRDALHCQPSYQGNHMLQFGLQVAPCRRRFDANRAAIETMHKKLQKGHAKSPWGCFLEMEAATYIKLDDWQEALGKKRVKAADGKVLNLRSRVRNSSITLADQAFQQGRCVETRLESPVVPVKGYATEGNMAKLEGVTSIWVRKKQ